MQTKLQLLLSVLFVFGLFILTSCNEDAATIIEDYNCEFIQNDDDMDGQIDDVEQALMQECSDNKYTSKDDIEDNLVGEWKLIGHGQGWSYTPSQPCAYLVITEDELTFKFENAQIDTMTIHTWEIIENSNNSFHLNLTPFAEIELAIDVFSEDYMYFNDTPLDGNMYLYEKVK